MIYINHNKKAIFIHIPKTGGTYIGPTLVKYYGFISYLPLIQKRRPDHDIFCRTNLFLINSKTGNPTYDNSFFNKMWGILLYCKTSNYLNEKMNMNEAKWKEYKKFCFIRNPYSRALSGWKHVNTILNLNTEFYGYISKNKFSVTDIEYGHVFMTQKQQIMNLDSTCGVDLIGKFENLEEDFRYILKEIGFDKIIHIPKKENVSNECGADTIVLERKTIQLLNELFKDDFELFHYKKINA
jgi:hypothetical protein